VPCRFKIINQVNQDLIMQRDPGRFESWGDVHGRLGENVKRQQEFPPNQRRAIENGLAQNDSDKDNEQLRDFPADPFAIFSVHRGNNRRRT